MNYETHIKPFADNFVRIKISEDNYIKADGFAKKMIAAKSKEEHHKIDNDSVYKRYYELGDWRIFKISLS